MKDITPVGFAVQPCLDQVWSGGDATVGDVCSEKFHAGLLNGSLIAVALWVALFFAIHG